MTGKYINPYFLSNTTKVVLGNAGRHIVTARLNETVLRCVVVFLRMK